uniref:ZP domain-containing protein n=1 Tax=Setaria digitata TaxID=48799 RepID=A0A915PHR1_9BILA
MLAVTKFLVPVLILGTLKTFKNSVGSNLLDNGILGDPYVYCGDNYIEVQFETRSSFKGLIFVEDHLADPSCRSIATESLSDRGRNASIRLGFKSCDVERRRSNNPRGIYVTASLFLAFHPEFLSKIDRVYVVQCLYMEMETVFEKQIQVKMNAPPLQTEQVPMPVCKYEILDGSPTGPPVFYAVIGQMVYHKWTCETDTENQFCMVVHSCFVDDGNGDRVQLIDEQGCAKDKYLLQNLEYVSDLVAGKEAHVYKYADRQSLFFDCQISLTVKEPNQEYCSIPVCPEPPRRRRQALFPSESRRQGEALNQEEFELEMKFSIPDNQIQKVGWFDDNFSIYQDVFCMSSVGFGTIAAMNLIMASTSALFFYGSCKHSLCKVMDQP